MRETKGEDPLVVILRSVKALDESKIQEAVKESSRVGMTLESTLAIKGELARATLNLYADAAAYVRAGNMTLDLAIRAVRLCNHESCSLDEAVGKLKGRHKATITVSSIANELMQMMIDAEIINNQQMSFAVVNGESTGMLPGRVLLLNKAVSSRGLEASISACLMLRQKVIEKDALIEALKRSHKKDCCLEQAMFELGTFKQPSNYNMRLSDILSMAGLINESDLLECRELSIAKNKSFKQIVLEQGLVDPAVLNFVVPLQNMVASNKLRPFEAARALNKICKQNMSLERATAGREHAGPDMLLGELLVGAGCVSTDDLSRVVQDRTSSNIKIGKMLLSAGLINDDVLVKSLRIQSAFKHGYLSRDQATYLLEKSAPNRDSLENNARIAGLFLPSHVQWSWV
ncbi:MAG: hypothetical protein R3F51_14120 [Cyanobacteriota/Melainabacteria group bacterium]